MEIASISESNRVFTLAYISVAITNYLDYVSRRNTMSDVQVAETAELILEEYPDLKFDDIALFFRFCKLSRFGKLYDLNGSVLLDWLNQYRQERSRAYWQLLERQEEKRREAEEQKAQEEWNALTPEQRAEQEMKINNIRDMLCKKMQTNNRKTQ